MLYRSMIRSLLYLTAHRSNILFNVGACARNQENPKELDLILVKRIIRYINGTLGYILWYPYDSSFMIVRYSNADQAENVEDRKNTFVACIFISDCLVAQLSKKQNSIALSIVEAEYIVVGSYCMQLPWIKQMLTNYGIEQRTLSIHCDNSNAINISKYLVLHSRTKHIEISHHFIRDLIEKMVVSLEFIPIEHQFANIFTKPLNSLGFEYLRKSLCICLID